MLLDMRQMLMMAAEKTGAAIIVVEGQCGGVVLLGSGDRFQAIVSLLSRRSKAAGAMLGVTGLPARLWV